MLNNINDKLSVHKTYFPENIRQIKPLLRISLPVSADCKSAETDVWTIKHDNP